MALQDESYRGKNAGEYKSRNVLCVTVRFYEIRLNIIMVFESAYDIESHCHLSLSIQCAETCMWRLVINKLHFALFLASLYTYVNVVACKSLKLLPGEDRSVLIVQQTLYCAFVLQIAQNHCLMPVCISVFWFGGLFVFIKTN
jgi:hypothetical protein